MLTLLAAATALSALCAEAKVAAGLCPRTVEVVGNFCRTGTVTLVCQNRNFTLEEQNGQRSFLFVEDRFDVNEGDVVTVKGELALHDDGTVFKVARHVSNIGRSPLPPPKKVTLADLARGDFLHRHVTTEGTLVLARRDEIDVTYTQLLIKDGANVLNASFQPGTNQALCVSSLLGARLRLTGYLMQPSGARRNTSSYLTVSTNGIEVLRPAPTDIFDVPRFDFAASWSPAELLKMDTRRFDGVVLATWGGDQMMLAGRDYRCVKAMLARPDELPTAGAAVVVAGFPDTDLYSVNLIYARCKVLSRKQDFGPAITPMRATLRQLLMDDHGRPRINGYSHGRLLKIRGTVLDVQPSLALFSLNDDEFTMPVDYSSSPDAIQRLETNSKIEIVALAVTETDSWRESIVLPQTRGLKLILRSPKDIRILSRPPWWTPTRLTVLIISLLVAIILIIAANRVINRIMMRRKVAERTRLAVELHDSLSQTLAGVACQIAAGHDAVADDPEAAKALLKTAERMLESSRTELKNCLFDLRNDTVDDPDFARAIAKTLTGFKTETRFSIRFNVVRSLMTDSTAHAVLCIIRELVANAVNHGAATHIRVAGTVDDRHLRFSVIDNGCGFDANHHPGPRDGHFGLAGIRERLADLGGEMAIESEAGRGTKVTLSLKLAKP